MKRASYQFTSAILVTGVLFAVVCGYMLWGLFTASAEDHAAYQALVTAANPTNLKGQPAPYVATQKRKQVQKDIIFSQGDERLQLRLISAESDIILDHQAEKTELIEKMRDVTCLMQQELYYLLPDGREALIQPNGKLLVRDGDPQDPSVWIERDQAGIKPMQQLHNIEAREAVYHYKSEMLQADNVHIARYIVPGHQIVSSVRDYKPYATAKANNVEFSIAGKEINFKATRMKATFNNGERPL